VWAAALLLLPRCVCWVHAVVRTAGQQRPGSHQFTPSMTAGSVGACALLPSLLRGSVGSSLLEALGATSDCLKTVECLWLQEWCRQGVRRQVRRLLLLPLLLAAVVVCC
jgi:hypothetical protein